MENLEHNEWNEEQETLCTAEVPKEEIPPVKEDAVPEEMPALRFDFSTALENARTDDVDEEVQSGFVWDDAYFAALGIDLSQSEEPEAEEPAAEVPSVAETAAEDNAEMEKPASVKEKDTWQKNMLMYLHDLVFLLAGVIVIFLLLFRIVVVSGGSMNRTLYNGDFLLLLSNAFYQEPEAGDIIVASKESFRDGAPIVKRIIATGGQWVYIDFDAGIVYVGDDSKNMKPLDEPYIVGSTTTFEGVRFPLLVEEGHVFVLGDNRNDSMDSRDPEIGLIDEREIMGKVIFLFVPGRDYRGERDFSRIGVVS